MGYLGRDFNRGAVLFKGKEECLSKGQCEALLKKKMDMKFFKRKKGGWKHCFRKKRDGYWRNPMEIYNFVDNYYFMHSIHFIIIYILLRFSIIEGQ